MAVFGYPRGRHAAGLFSTGKHTVEKTAHGKHSIVHSTGWYVNRTARKSAMPAFAALLSSSMTVSSMGLPLAAVADPVDSSSSNTTNSLQLSSAETLTEEELLKKLLEEAQQDEAAASNTANQSSSQSGVKTPVAKSEDQNKTANSDKTSSQKSDNKKTDATDKDAKKADTDKKANESADPNAKQDPNAVQDSNATQDPNATQDSNTVHEPKAVEQPETPPQPEPAPVEQDANSEENTPAAPVARSSSSAGSYTSVADDGSTLSATVTELKVANRLLDAGWTPEMIAAAIGNMYAESGSNAASFDNMSGMFNYSYEVAGGLFQWTDCGSSEGALSSAGFTGLVDYAQMCGTKWQDPTLQTEYFLKTWRDSWMERQTYYDASSPEYAHVDVALSAFDESNKSDFDGDGIVDSRDNDIDGDGIVNASDPVNEREVNGKKVQYSANSALHLAMNGTAVTRTEEEAHKHVADLTFAFMAGYEGPSASVSHLDRRVAHALRMYPAILALKESRNLELTDNAALVVASAATMLGGTYVWGGESPAEKIFDCSGLTQWCYSLIGVDIDHYSETQYVQANQIKPIADAVPGDILWKPGHVGIYIGNGTTIEAKGVNYGIVYGDANSFDAALHFDVIDQRSGEEDSWKTLQPKAREQALAVPAAIQNAADLMLK